MKRAFLSSVVVAAVFICGASPSSGSNWAGASGLTGCSGNNMTENSQVAISYPSVSAPIKTAMVNGAVLADSSTDIVVSTTTSLVYDDVRIFDDYYAQLCGFQTAWGSYVATGNWSGVIGMARCEVKHAVGTTYANRCDRHYVYFDESTKEVLTAAQLKANAVHELGHALGLNHNSSSDSVMKQNNLGVSAFNAHDRGHINAAF